MAITIVLVTTTALLAATVQATAGLGFALIVTPVLFLEMSPASAIVTATVLGILLNLLVLFAEPRRPTPAWDEVLPILAAAIPGAACGVVLLAALPRPALQVFVGMTVIAAALLRTRRPGRSRRRGARSRLALGYVVGALSTSTGINGPPLALWLAGRGLSPAQVRDSLSTAFLGTGVIATLTIVPVVSHARLPAAIIGAAAGGVLVGHAVGSRLFTRLAVARYDHVLLAIILAAGAGSLVAGATSL
ncbi:MAG TPA: sulfite exporter TauE/SafE family protein [Solirubrobacteraceae bacterium]|jgi:hypothetical protein|nr:sulfite exporter TauE/SafE family protein [Solirubrobacteraceae bacterium]